MNYPTIKLPKMFFEDHTERGLKTPKVLNATRSHYIVSSRDKRLRELFSDAIYYADKSGGPDCLPAGLKSSARATVAAIKAAESGA
jgi:hypothetical protein